MDGPTVATKAAIEQVFDSAAALYGRTGPNLFEHFGARLVELMPIEPGARVLDVGTGTGAVLVPAGRRVGPTGHVVGIDLSAEMLRQADSAARLAGLSNFETKKMDAEELQFEDASFDAIACGFSLFLLPSMEAGLSEMYRVCKIGGCIGLTMWSKNPPPFDPAWKIFADQVRRYRVEVRMPQRIAQSSGDIVGLLESAGFERTIIVPETLDAVYEREEEWWQFQLTMASRAAIERLSEEMRPSFREEYLSQLRPMFQSDGLHLPAPALLAVAFKGNSSR